MSKTHSTHEPATMAGLQLGPAEPADAAAIFALKQQAFAASSLLYTVYQAPQSFSYLRDLISQRAPGQRFAVLRVGGLVAGYYHAVRLNQAWLLNYIAVADREKGHGFGTLLLNDFEHQATGCQTLFLDVFESNTHAVRWYTSRGFGLRSSQILSRLSVTRVETAGCFPLLVEERAMANALAEERQQGFSKVTCCARTAGRITLGFINGQVVKILEFDGLTLEQAVKSVAPRFRGARDVLVVSSPSPLPAHWPILSAERSLRLSKILVPEP